VYCAVRMCGLAHSTGQLSDLGPSVADRAEARPNGFDIEEAALPAAMIGARCLPLDSWLSLGLVSSSHHVPTASSYRTCIQCFFHHLFDRQ
jgi:hypothetical protein